MPKAKNISRRAFLQMLGGAALSGVALSQMPGALAMLNAQLLGTQDNTGAYRLPDLPYAYDALEPVIDAETMRIHHRRHHAAYTRNLNATLEGTRLQGQPIERLLQNLDRLPPEMRESVRNNGGGYYNHTFFWDSMSPDGGGRPSGNVGGAIDFSLGCYEALQAKFRRAAAGLFGSGWAWLVRLPNRQVQVVTTANQDSPIMRGVWPLLALDLWEHAYYLQYRNAKLDYVDAWWDVVNWQVVERRYNAGT